MSGDMMKSMPFLLKPKNLEGMIGGEAEFDPLGFAENFDPKWLREAELGRPEEQLKELPAAGLH